MSDEAALRPFERVMREQGMVAPATLARAIEDAVGTRDGGRGTRDGGSGAREASGVDVNMSADPQADAETFLRAAERVLERVLSSECESRDSALDLLTVDALMTRAMAVVAHDSDALEKLSELAMKRIASR